MYLVYFGVDGAKEATANGPLAAGTGHTGPSRRSAIQIPLRIEKRSNSLAFGLGS